MAFLIVKCQYIFPKNIPMFENQFNDHLGD